MSGEKDPPEENVEDTLALTPKLGSEVHEPAPEPQIPGYRLLQMIGEGGMGEVWLAEQLDPRRRVALKLIKLGMDTKQVLARFESERQALAMMDHPAIARVFDGGTTSTGRPFFVMEYVAGVPITEHCDTHKLSTEARLELLATVCEGVQHAHQKAIIHRDLKPSNILVSLVAGKPQPKIIDFGIAKATGYRLTDKTLFTEIGTIIGTPEYMSPEQADLTGQDIDTRTDVYSLGVLLYQLLTGQLPFASNELRSSSYDELRRKLKEVEPPRPSNRLSTLGNAAAGEAAHNRHTEALELQHLLEGDLDAITMKALEKERNRRYGTPSELSADIARYLRQEPVLARSPSAKYRLGKYIKRHRTGVALSAGLVLLLLGFATSMAVVARRLATERDRANRERDASEKVSAFLSSMLSGIKPEAMGLALWGDLHERVAKARQDAGASDEQVSMALSSFDKALGGVNPTNVALRLLDEQILDRAGKTLERDYANEPRITGSLELTLGKVYLSIGLLKQAESHAKRSFAVRKLELGPTHPDTLRAMSNLALIYERQGRLEDSEKASRETLEGMRRVLGPQNSDTLKTLNNLGLVLEEEGHHEEAERIYRDLLETDIRVFGPDHHDTLAAMNNLAAVYSAEGKYDEAEKLQRATWKGRLRVLGPNAPETLQSSNNLANLQIYQGNYVEAEKLLSETLAIQRRVLGNEHPETLSIMGNLAAAEAADGHYPEAVSLYLGTLEGQRHALGTEHPDTLDTLNGLASTYIQQGLYLKAEAIQLEALSAERRVLGDENSTTLSGEMNLADIYSGERRYLDAEGIAAAIVTTLEKAENADKDIMAAARVTLGRSLVGLKRFAEAEFQLLAAEKISPVMVSTKKRCLDALVELYRQWEAFEPGKGHREMMVKKQNSESSQ
jgi:serine/threonine protein kinase